MHFSLPFVLNHLFADTLSINAAIYYISCGFPCLHFWSDLICNIHLCIFPVWLALMHLSILCPTLPSRRRVGQGGERQMPNLQGKPSKIEISHVCLCVCLCVCTYHVRRITSLHYYICHANSTVEVCRPNWAKVREASLVLCCLDGEKVVGSDDTTVLASPGR